MEPANYQCSRCFKKFKGSDTFELPILCSRCKGDSTFTCGCGLKHCLNCYPQYSVDKVLPFTGPTKLDLDPNQVLEGAKDNVESAIVLGYDNEGELYVASSLADKCEILWLLEKAKEELLKR